ncbi:competence protein CoiA [Lacticaseibacillus saniviri]|uniref:Competence protein n=1 Tax=Lacticaseibacillus saniviri JCM 17471 = DSM 24301 TaxID=1293598 RepID=A0A0R2MTP0_9LACO|nr:competence protein CoiA family protein [Lacticaseibacillus saniviri]KRO16793.1 hypothetical protein IV56_GL000782 [Lacticaseibacillus saniviri JCM 17471 = DSM 24301]MCG4282985.1 competence protein [Lacticaseibacillus saniviri]
MFIALNQAHERVWLQTHEQAATLSQERFFCPACEQPVRVRNGKQNPAHFAHIAGTCSASEPESHQHLTGKQWLYDFYTYLGWSVELEVYLPTIKQRADLIIQKSGHKLVIEFQCSPISVPQLKARTDGYTQLGLPVIWILGSRYFAPRYQAKQQKFLTQELTLWFLDMTRQRLDRWQWQPSGWLITQYGHHYRQYLRPSAHSPKQAQLQLARQLYYRQPQLRALQEASYRKGINLAGVPWVVQLQLTGLPGLVVPEWQLRTWWLLRFQHSPVTREANHTFWQRALGNSKTPLLAWPSEPPVMKRWLTVLTRLHLLEEDEQGWHWLQTPQWYPDSERKLQQFDDFLAMQRVLEQRVSPAQPNI